MKFAVLLVFTLFTSLSLAENGLVYLGDGVVATQADAACATSNDQYENPVRYTEASQNYSGQCLDTTRYRPLVVLEDTSKKIKFANYKHEDTYWTAEISKSAQVDQVYFQVVRFNVVSGVTAAHTQFRVRFKKGHEIKLVNQLQPAQTQTMNDIVVSFDAARPKAVAYNFALGAFNNYAVVAQAMSGLQRQKDSSTESTEQYPLDLAGNSEKLGLLLSSIQKSAEMRAARIYNTIRPNCTTEVFDLIDLQPSVAKRNPIPFLTVISNNPIAGPSVQALAERGLLLGRSPDLKAELENNDFSQPVPVPQEETLDVPFLTNVKDWPYSIIDVSNKDIPKARQLLYDAAPGLLQAIGASAMTVENAEKVLLNGLKDLSAHLEKRLVEMNDKLPLKAKYVRLYFAPLECPRR